MPKYLKKISSIIDKYNFFLIDLSGVIHNGLAPYPNALDAIYALKDKGKQVIFFSNTPRPKASTNQKLVDLGFKFTNEYTITAGDLFLYEQKLEANHQNKKTVAYPLGLKQNQDLGLDKIFKLTDNITEAEVLILLAFLENTSELDNYDDILDLAAKRNLTALCPNPDTIVYHGDELRYPAGYIASKYELLGGVVKYYGKPYKPMYDFALQDQKIDKSKILAIGDNLSTDILGASNYGIDSLLISEGIYKNITNINLLIEGYKIFPTYISDYLQY